MFEKLRKHLDMLCHGRALLKELPKTFHCTFDFTSYLSVFSPNAGKYGPEKPPYFDYFHAVYTCCYLTMSIKNKEKRFLR